MGRAVICTVWITELNVSQINARLSFARGHWYIQDMKSQSGVLSEWGARSSHNVESGGPYSHWRDGV